MQTETIDPVEYEEIFPEEQEYRAWIMQVENDYLEEVNFLATIAARRDRDNFELVYDDPDQDLSPYATINS